MIPVQWDPSFLTLGIGGTAAVLGGALALGIRHGIDWDHIAAITDITSTSVVPQEAREGWLGSEPGVMLTDERHHALASAVAGSAVFSRPRPDGAGGSPSIEPRWLQHARAQRVPFFLGSMYALGHGSMVIALGLSAILFQQILPDWIDPLMERVVGATLLFLSLYLFYSLYRYFRNGEEFRIRSRWMLVFAVVGNTYHRLSHKLGVTADHGHDHNHVHEFDGSQQYGARTAYGIGLIHGIGAETGTQVLIIGTAVGAQSKGLGVVTLFSFVFGIIISNSIVTVMTTTGFVSAHRRNVIYVVVGLIAAMFSLVVGLVFLSQSTNLLPSLDQYFSWIGGPTTH